MNSRIHFPANATEAVPAVANRPVVVAVKDKISDVANVNFDYGDNLTVD